MSEPTGSAGQQFQTEAEVMRTAANHTDDVNGAVRAELARVQDVAEGTRAYWTGSAQLTFANLMARYDDAERRLGEALTDIAVNIRSNAGNYEETETVNAEAFQSIMPNEGLPL
ncbi:WXG100 family type VII secretion target [Corynebacterium cystitidis]|uniref:WXG100 family type VII secretion target n=1 Tax=Corynebacterium cystitidis DSM 20524 TaxID=1121357 RepID=A0A1H9R0S7_9CORY|nr:WXG100 family type VII secretion target [Corynebacterium cystitidis]WJY81589.1 WXG domain conatining protein [Corynebacterium cystitidis DSM 20524]SER66308.1 WXG100 family type VII secretion target [Corynebacterium cystitidis DSM 20524]SNV85847.1 CFP-10-like protein [Corynebacterium cystitidis]